jgi:CHRD domain
MRKLLAFGLMAGVATAVAATAVAAFNQNFSTHLKGTNERPEPRETNAQGQALFHLSEDGTTLEYKLIVANIDNVGAAHIHLGDAETAGPVVAFLYGNAPAGGGALDGVIAEGTITAADLIGPLAGHPLSDLVAAIQAGNAYVNVHTNDGVAPTNTGASDFPGGEVRAQLVK